MGDSKAGRFRQKLYKSGLVTPESEKIDEVLLKEHINRTRKRGKGHEHKWFIPPWSDGATEHCLGKGCMKVRPVERDCS